MVKIGVAAPFGASFLRENPAALKVTGAEGTRTLDLLVANQAL